ncbi:hypothetical protein PC118_g22445 [Phytophthora cactorum]|uniref:Uncharacterized protein n=1 Tax=Phytophthora cactorum TaxID=29920 RepID=A0A8T1F2R6_9STRA|nr:hypothetical protein PC111_g24330 [Phytophthora cactorum]KAG2958920.1 hypothetical protein PC119_g26865 [Phytophthora cactorum]KAG2960553.1 hypothetical protein PC118_g22445 [Phytophthora cactorum]KAG3045766.1 hypothetical protein PC122_g24520 [Phytophthora cactorum]KAG3110437.1 hypothetical protein C6341_g27902 [Phytophthora cactorum]
MYLESRKSLSSKAFRTRSLLCKPRVCHTVQSNGNGIRDLIGNNYGQVHIPLRKDWKKRLVNRKKQLWYPVCVESNVDASAKKDAVLMS